MTALASMARSHSPRNPASSIAAGVSKPCSVVRRCHSIVSGRCRWRSRNAPKSQQHVEAVVGALPRPPGLVSAVAPIADRRAQDLGSLLGRQLARDREELIVREVALGVERGGDDLHLAVGVPVGERDLRPRFGVDPRQRLRRHVVHGLAGLTPVRGPGASAFVHVDAREERRDHLAELDEHQVAVLAHLGERVRGQSHQELLVGLSGRVDPQVRTGRGRQEQSQGVARLGQDRRSIDEVGVAVLLREPFHEEGLQRLVHPPVGGERRVEVRRGTAARSRRRRSRAGSSRATRRRACRRSACIASTAPGMRPDVPTPTPCTAAATPARTPGARPRAAPPNRRRTPRTRARRAVPRAPRPARVSSPVAPHVLRELVQEQSPQRLLRPGVPGEQRALHDLRQVREREHRPVEVREMAFQGATFVRGERLGRVPDRHVGPDGPVGPVGDRPPR